jgi:hypothetical protein
VHGKQIGLIQAGGQMTDACVHPIYDGHLRKNTSHAMQAPTRCCPWIVILQALMRQRC